jgi:DHA1 family tetracycline resistance protein-like MFS transporter
MTERQHHWQDWIEPWYLAYALMGMAVAGLAPVLIPLVVGEASGSVQVGWVMAVISLGGLTAPIWGGLADRYRLHRWLLAGGLLLTAVGLGVFPTSLHPVLWYVLALVQGIGAASSATVANLFVVEGHPKDEWDERIGWLQTFYGGGQVAGLLLVAYLSQLDFRISLEVSAGLCVIAVLLGWLTTKTPPAHKGSKPVLVHPVRHAEWPIHSPQRLFHHLNRKTFENLGASLGSSFGIFLLVWFLSFTGAATVFSQYPLLMQKLFHITPGLSSAAFAIAAGVGLSLYTPAGILSEHRGPGRVLRAALGLRLLAFLGMLGLGASSWSSKQGWLALIGFGLVVCAWSLLSVSGTSLAVSLFKRGKGEGLGLFNSVTAIAGVVGAAAGGWVAGTWGYNAIFILAAFGVAAGLGLSIPAKLSVEGTKSSSIDVVDAHS